MPSLHSLSLRGAASGSLQLTLALSADAAQAGCLTVTEGATPTGGDGVYTYAWTLHDPHGTARTPLLSDATAQAPTWTPDAIGGVWVARCTVTDGAGATAQAARIVEVGADGWVELLDVDFALEGDQSLSGGALTVSNRARQGAPAITLTAFNDGSSSGFEIVSGRLVITPNGSTPIASAASTQSAPGVKVTLADMLAGLAAESTRDMGLLTAAQMDDWTPANTGDQLGISWGASTGPGEGSTTTSGGGVAYLINATGPVERLGVIGQKGSSRYATDVSGAGDKTGARVLVAQHTGFCSAVAQASTTSTDADTLAAAAALVAPGASGVVHVQAMASSIATAGAQPLLPEVLRWYVGTSSGSAGAPVSLERLRVWVRGLV